MAAIVVRNVEVMNNPAAFNTPFQFDITFECYAQLEDDLEWKVIYVGSAESEEGDQELSSVLVGPFPEGMNKFSFVSPPPDPSQIPHDDVLGVTVVLVTCSYKDKEFVRIGYYISNHYEDPLLNEQPPEIHDYSRIARVILSDKPRVTRFDIPWDQPASCAPVVTDSSPVAVTETPMSM